MRSRGSGATGTPTPGDDPPGGRGADDESLRGLPPLVAALDARDVDTALGWLADDVRVQVDGWDRELVGRAAVATRLRELLGQTSDSRFQVHFSAQAHGRARQEITVAARRLPPGDHDWVVVRGTATWEVTAAGTVRRVHVAVDREALAAQWHGAAPLRAGSFRTELALASFDPDEAVRTRVTVLQDPEPTRRRRAGALVAGTAVLAVMAGVAVVSVLAPGEDATPVAAPSVAASDGASAPAVTPAPSPVPTEPPPVPPGPTASATVSVVPSQEPGLRAEEGGAVVEEDDGTQVLSLSEAVLFDPGSASLSPEAGAVLGGVADRLVGAEGELVVVGHTDDIGTAAANDRLAAARAEAVASVIAGRLGQGPVAIVTDARGSREPVAGNDTADGRAANRRVELRFTPAG